MNADSWGQRLPVVAIIGRPNAGKSTLFNCLCKTRRALVAAEPGITRDRNIAVAEQAGRRFILVDTGGFDPIRTTGVEAAIRAQMEMAIEDADAILLLVDGRAGVSPADRAVVDRLRRTRKPVWLAVNKLDTPALDDEAVDFFSLGIERVVPVSAAHGRGVRDLVDQVLEALPAVPEPEPTALEPGAEIAIAIVGRPNVGKSSLLNRLVGYDRAIVTPSPGTTRDAIDTPVEFRGQQYLLVDTAGVRRRPRVRQHIERASAVRALRALERCHVGAMVIDASEGMADQDARIARYAFEKGRGLFIVVNKCDLVGGARRAASTVVREVRRSHPYLDDVPIVCVSASNGEGIGEVLGVAAKVAANHGRQIPTSRLNQIVSEAVRQTEPPSVRGKRATFQYAVQTGQRPPAITIFCSAPTLIPVAYTRYLIHCLRTAFELKGTPVRIHYRSRRAESAVQVRGRRRRGR